MMARRIDLKSRKKENSEKMLQELIQE